MALYQIFYFTAVATAGVAVPTLVTICTGPLLVALLSGALLGERLTHRIAVALVLGLLGTVLLVGFPEDVGIDRPSLLAGVAWASGSALSYATLVLCARALAHKRGPFEIIVVGFGAGALLLLPFVLTGGSALAHSAEGWLLLLYIGFVPAALTYAFYFHGMRRTPATPASIIALMEPLTATLLAWLIFQERLGPLSALGGALLLFSLIVLSRAHHRL